MNKRNKRKNTEGKRESKWDKKKRNDCGRKGKEEGGKGTK